MPGKRRRVIWAPRSKRDLLDVWRYYERIASGDVADKLLREISEAGERLADQALMWRARDEVAAGASIGHRPPLHSVLSHARRRS